MSTGTQLLALAFVLGFPSIGSNAWGQPLPSDTGRAPRLEAFVTPSDYYQSLPSARRLPFGDGRGFLVEENLIDDRYPTPAVPIFFDEGSDRIPDKYLLSATERETLEFSENTLPGGTLEKYQRGLDIIGFRLRQFPKATITLTGCNSHEPARGENRAISDGRARAVADHLRNVWGIETSRITVVVRDLPSHPSNIHDPDGAAENRRVEFASSDPRVTTILHPTELRRYPQPDSMLFEAHSGIDPSLVARCRIEIRRGGEHWATILNVVDGTPTSYNFGHDHDMDSIPTDERPYVAELVVEKNDGGVVRSAPVEVPVWIVRLRRSVCEGRVGYSDRYITRFSLILFSFDTGELEDLNRRILDEEVFPSIETGSHIEIIGYTDIIGSEEHNQTLSEQRANGVAQVTRANRLSGWRAISDSGVGETAPLYTNELPEGRFYNRTVQLRVVTPFAPYNNK